MTLVVFDLDGTLLDKTSKISGYTADTLALMRAKRIPYTVATGRTLQAAAAPLRDHYFTLPMILGSSSHLVREVATFVSTSLRRCMHVLPATLSLCLSIWN